MADKPKFKIAAKAVAAVPAAPASVAAFTAGADLVKAQTAGRPLKPVRLNLDLDPDTHRRLRIHAIQTGEKVAGLIRRLVEVELSR